MATFLIGIAISYTLVLAGFMFAMRNALSDDPPQTNYRNNVVSLDDYR